MRAAFAALFNQSATEEGRALVEAQLGLCEGTLEGEEDAFLVALALMVGAFDTAAMGSSPTASSYFTGMRATQEGAAAGGWVDGCAL